MIGITEHKINEKLINIDFSLSGYVLCYNETESSHGGTGFFVSNKLSFKQQSDLVINEAGKLESTFIILVLPNKRNAVYRCVYKHPIMKTKFFDNAYLTPLLLRINKEEKICLLMVDFNINLLSSDTKPEVSDFFDNLSLHLFAPCILQPTRLAKTYKTFIVNIFINTIEFGSYSGNFTSQISDHLLQFAILKDLLRKPPSNQSDSFGRNYKFINHDEFKNDLKNIQWQNL